MNPRAVFLTFIFWVTLATSSRGELPPVTLKSHGSLYFLGGLNRNWFTPSDISYKGSGYEISILGLKAHDRWEPYPFKDWAINTPQFSFRGGYLFKYPSTLGIELSIDHVRYVVNENQQVHVSGLITDTSIVKDTTIVDNNVTYQRPNFGLEHANGSLDITLNFVKQFHIVSSQYDDHILHFTLKPGGGILIPKSDVRLFGPRNIHGMHLAGYTFGVETSIRYMFIGHIVLEIAGKGSYANYFDVLTVGDGKAKHNYLSFRCLATLGYQFRI